MNIYIPEREDPYTSVFGKARAAAFRVDVDEAAQRLVVCVRFALLAAMENTPLNDAEVFAAEVAQLLYLPILPDKVREVLLEVLRCGEDEDDIIAYLRLNEFHERFVEAGGLDLLNATGILEKVQQERER